MDSLNKLDILGASMNQLGRSVYAICESTKKKKVLDVFNSYKPEIKLFSLRINENNPIFLK
jgi:hypothetical protein